MLALSHPFLINFFRSFGVKYPGHAVIFSILKNTLLPLLLSALKTLILSWAKGIIPFSHDWQLMSLTECIKMFYLLARDLGRYWAKYLDLVLSPLPSRMLVLKCKFLPLLWIMSLFHLNILIRC